MTQSLISSIRMHTTRQCVIPKHLLLIVIMISKNCYFYLKNCVGSSNCGSGRHTKGFQRRRKEKKKTVIFL